MDGLHRPLGCSGAVRLDGEAYWMEPLTLGRLAACESWMMAERGTVLDGVTDVADHFPADLSGYLWEAALDDARRDKSVRVISLAELQAWIDEPDGIAFTSWLCLRGSGHPAFSLLSAATAYWAGHPADAKAFVRQRNRISGLDWLAQMDWPKANPKDKGPAYIPWRKIVVEFAEARNWPPEVVAGLTLYNLRLCQMSSEQMQEGFGKQSFADYRARHGIKRQKGA